MKSLRFSYICLIVFCLFSLTRSAWAINAQWFQPAPDGMSLVTVYRAQGLPQGHWQAGAYLNWVLNPVEFGTPSGERITDVVTWFLTLDSMLSYAPTDWLSFYTGVPVHFAAEISPLSTGVGNTEKLALGDIRVGSLLTLKKSSATGNSLGLAVAPFLTAPTGNVGQFQGDSKVTYGLRVVGDYWLNDRNYFVANVGFRMREREIILNLDIDDEFLVAFGYERKFFTKHPWWLFAEMQNSTTFRQFYSDEVTTPLEVLGGIKTKLGGHWVWLAGAGRGITNGYGAPDVRAFTGVTYNFKRQQLPKAIEPGEVLVTVKLADGTPLPSKLTIRREGQEDALLERDGIAKLAYVLPPGRYTIQSATEGYYDKRGIFTIASEDRTLVPIVLKRQKLGRIEGLGKVLFDLNRAKIKSESHQVLNEVVDLLKRYPEITLMQIEAHTDSQGSDEYNRKLSQSRASVVMQYLIENGIAAERLTAQGFGESKPIATNETREGRAKNRRVEFVIKDTVPEDVTIQEYAPSKLYNKTPARIDRP